MRTLVDLPDDDVAWLDGVARAEGKSRTAVVREAITAFRHAENKTEMEQYFGLWERHGSRVDGLAYERELREEWPTAEGLDRSSRSDVA
ncbi:ribbon-helix-helix protein, CopG family [Sphingomonas qilianensis]|uniref:Ribbon-helix-helix protein, CopG family n=1 Tax=Sphingomonas qilianensis TaxID=1736690 RepID=A0ABU9XV43_9SPHN